MQYQYILRIVGKNSSEIARILGPSSDPTEQWWAFQKEEGPSDPPTPFVDVFLGVLQDKFSALENIGVARDDITIWLLYEYDDQCNLEFSARDLKLLGNARISLCVSCWQASS
jgi:hypothetical protein